MPAGDAVGAIAAATGGGSIASTRLGRSATSRKSRMLCAIATLPRSARLSLARIST